MDWPKNQAVRYALTALAVGLVFALRLALDPILHELQPFAFFFAPVLLMGWWLGPGPAILAAILGWFMADWFFCSPRHSILAGGNPEVTATVVYTFISAALVSVTHYMRQSRKEVETILGSISDGFFALDWQWRFTYANREAERLLNKSGRDLIGRRLWEVFPDSGIFRKHYEQAVATGQASHFEEYYAPMQKCFEVHTYPSPAGLSIYFRDITAQREAEEKLRRSEKQFRAIFEQAAIGIGLVRFEDGRWRDVNESFCESLGYTPEFMRATPWPQITHPEDVTPLLIPFQRMAAGELDFYSTEKRFLHKDGHYVWSRLTLSLVRDEQGRPDYEIAIIENINARKRAEEHLRESQEALHLAVQQFETLANTMPQIVWSTRPDGYHDYFNDRWYEFTGMPREEGQGWNWWNYLHPDDIGPTLEVWNRSLATGEPYEVQYRFRRASDGVYRWFITRAMPIHDLNGKVSRWFGTCTDITEQKETEEALRRSEQRHRTLFDSGLIGTYYANINGKIIEANNKFLQMLGYTREELNAGLIRWTELTPPEFREGDAQVVAELKTSGITRRPYEKEYLRKDGTRLPVIVGSAKVDEAQYDTVAFVLDISERKRTEAALRRRHEHLQLLHQATARLLIGQQPAELIRQLHSQIAKTFGAEAFMLYQSNGDGSLHLEACEGFDEEQKRQLENLRDGRAICAGSEEALQPIIATHIQSREAPNRHFVRKLGFRSYLYYPLVLNNRLHGSLAFGSRQRDSYDRSDLEFFQTIARTLAEALERQHLQRELQRHTAELESIVRERTAKLQDTVAELEGFSYSIVHDMRAPLRAMQGYASILEEKTGPRLQAKEGDLLRKIKMAANRMDQLITDSLNYTRILRQELPVGVVNLGALLRSMVETYPNLQPPESEIRLDIGDLMVRGNEAALTQVFSNLLGNAVKFVAPGVKPRVHVWAEVQDRRNSARVYIQDNGIGIPKEAHQKIFGMFQRLHRANEYPGTGIGLALVRKSLQRTGGEISVDSEPGKGSRFCVQLPLAQVVINTTEIEKAA